MDPLKSSRKGKDRDPPRDAPQPTDIDERLLAFRRRTAGPARPKEKSDKDRHLPPAPPIPPSRSPKTTSATPTTTLKSSHTSPRKPHPHLQGNRPTVDADADEFSRRLNISTPTPRAGALGSSKQMHGKLFNPNADPIPVRRNIEPEPVSDATTSSYVHVPRVQPAPAHTSPHTRERDVHSHPRQLFDHRRDDPVRFSVLARPQAGSHRAIHPSADYMSASSSSYAPSISSSFTLTSTTDNSSASSAVFDQGNAPKSDEAASNAFANKLKKLYREIVSYEAKIQQEDAAEEGDSGRSMHLQGKQPVDEKEQERWKKQIEDHKKLADVVHNLLQISLSPSVPSSLRNIPTKYNIIVRLWTFAFHKLLESLRRASFTSPVALEQLQSFIYYAYTFYTGLFEEPNLADFKSGWLEALGDLARYRMAVAVMVNSHSFGGNRLTAASLSEVATQAPKPDQGGPKSVSDIVARIDDSAPPSVGIAAARALEVEPEKERWRQIARDWYSKGLAELPGGGKLHHHLGLLCREVETEELKGAYHFLKSLTAQQPFMTARESILPIWSVAAQTRRSLPDARVSELFVMLHGMLFTNIQLDDFHPTLARLIERLAIDGADEREWIMMGIINITALLEYGKPTSLIRTIRVANAATVKVMSKSRPADERMDVDEVGKPDGMMTVPHTHANQPSPAPSDVDDAPEPPTAFTLALQLTFSMLSFALRNPLRKPNSHSKPLLNPYIGIILTFLTTMAKKNGVLDVLERSIPWEELADFFQTVPRSIVVSQLDKKWTMLTSDCRPPLNEDWCMRGMEWVAKKVFVQGYFKVKPDTVGERPNDQRMELEVLEMKEGVDFEDTDGQIEDDDDNGGKSKLELRWIRVFRCGLELSKMVNGFTCSGGRQWKVEGQLAEKVRKWREQGEIARQEEERRRMGRRWADDSMDVDEDESNSGDGLGSEDSEDDPDDSDEVKELKARRRYLRRLLGASRDVQRSTTVESPRTSMSRKATDSLVRLNIVAGYTILIIDTNIFLSSLSNLASVIESMRWTVVIPLPVIMELDGLALNDSQLGIAAQNALSYITSHIRTHSASLKVQTSKGNYLTSLNVRTEQVDFSHGNPERNMDDLILKAAIWQEEHWVDRSAMLGTTPKDTNTNNAVKVVLLSLDRNLRVKARARQLPAANERELAAILAPKT
ncbi:hypothetical protein AX16_010474 [Volvariella volvacea WC 439]|nr:hypothetical protein AX16_010474 [Volvariella volvacea WC 439]